MNAVRPTLSSRACLGPCVVAGKAVWHRNISGPASTGSPWSWTAFWPDRCRRILSRDDIRAAHPYALHRCAAEVAKCLLEALNAREQAMILGLPTDDGGAQTSIPCSANDWIGIGSRTRPVAYRTSGTLAQTQARLAVSRMAVTRNTQCSPSVAAMAPPESGPSDWPRNIADAVTP